MTRTISIPANEAGVVRVFALSLETEQAKALKANAAAEGAPAPQARALGCASLDSTHIEVFPLADLGDMAFADYLVEGAGVQTVSLEGDRLKLAALEGWVMVIYSGAFEGVAQTLSLSQDLALIGSYPQQGIDLSAPLDLSTPSALPKQTAPLEPPAKKRPSDAAMSGRIATLALLVAFAVVGLMFWVGS